MNKGKAILILFVLALLCKSLDAQNCDPGKSCFDAPLVCGSSLDGFTGSTGASNDITQPSVFCGVIENNQWLRFVACESTVVIEIQVSNCAGTLTGSGLQAEILSTTDCSDFTSVSDCFSPQVETDGEITATGLTPGGIYYLMIDGWAGDQCNYILNVKQGIDTAPPNPSEISAGQLTGDNNVCPNDVKTYTAQLPTCSNQSQSGCLLPTLPPSNFTYQWTIPADASIIGDDDQAEVQIQWGNTGGVIKVEVTDGSNGDCNCTWTCSTTIPELSVTVNTTPPNATILPTVYICEGDSYPYCGNSYSTTIDATCGDDCLDITIQPIVVLPVEFENLGEIALCEGECYPLGDSLYCEPGFHTTTVQTPNGCERKGFEIKSIKLDAFYNPSGVLNPRDTVIILLGGGGSNNGDVNFSWDGPGILPGQENEQNPEVNEAGPYIVTITDEQSGCTTTFTVLVQYQQDPCNLPVPPSDSCDVAPLLCGSALNGYCSSTGNYNPTFPGNLSSVFCESIENNQWLRFTPCLSDVIISLSVNACMTGGGVEAVLLAVDDCEQFSPVSNCVQVNDQEELELTATGLVPGDIYYIMIDGQSGADCNWEIEVIDGISTEPIILQQTTEPEILGPEKVCPGEIVTYTAIPSDCTITGGDNCPYNELLDSLKIEWILPAGALLLSGEGTLEIEVQWPAGSSGQIEANISTALSDDNSFCSAQNNCGSYASIGVAVELNTTFLPPIVLCKGDQYPYCNTIYFETIDAVCADACQQTIQPLIFQEPQVNDLGLIKICEGKCFDYEGQDYCDEDFYEISIPNGPCTDIVRFQIEFEKEAELSISEVIEDCDIFGNTYQIVFDITDGVPPFYVNGKLQNSTTFNSGPLLNGFVYNFEISHSAECSDSTIIITGTKNCTCLTEAGTMSEKLLVNCEIGDVSATHFEDEYLDANDAFEYIIHKGDSIELVEPLAINFTGVFSFMPDQMEYGETYYISAVAGNAIDGGYVDLNAVCLSISIGQPVIWYPQAIAQLPEDQVIDCNDPSVIISGDIKRNNPNTKVRWLSPNGESFEQQDLEISKGGQYTFFVLDTLTGCETSDDIIILEDFTPPQVEAIGGTITCYEPSIRLRAVSSINDLTLQWQNPSGQELIQATPLVSEIGQYTLVARGGNGCTTSIPAQVVDGTNYPNVNANADDITCTVSAAKLIATTNVNQASYLWKGPGGFSSVKPIIETSQQGVYNLFITELVSGCVSDTLLEVIKNTIKPQVEIQPAEDFTCKLLEVQLDATNSSQGDSISFQWTALQNSTLQNNNTLTPRVTKPDTYILNVLNESNGCSRSDSIEVIQNENVPEEILSQLSPPICHGDNNGVIFIENTNGGVPPFVYAFEDEDYSTQQNWLNLPAGEYLISVKDGNECEYEQLITLDDPPLVEASFPEAYSIKLGETVLLSPFISLSLNDLPVVQWESSFGESLNNESQWLVQPYYSTDYELTIADENNCKAVARTKIIVDRELPVYIPNVFSPNGDGNNDVFFINASEVITQVKKLQIFNRWGGLMFEIEDTPVNDAAYGWNGQLGGEDLNNAVFVYLIELETIEGEVVEYKGDVTLVK